MRAVSGYDFKYVNTAGYWFAFHEAAIDIRQEKIDESKIQDANRMDLLAVVAVKHYLRTIGLRTKFSKMSIDRPVHTKLVFPILNKRRQVAVADNLDKALSYMLSDDNTTQMMKLVVAVQASNATSLVVLQVMDSQHAATVRIFQRDEISSQSVAPVMSTKVLVQRAAIRYIRAPSCALRT